jgi:hypothetical protein
MSSLGTLLRYLQGQVSPTAELVGVDILNTFLPKSPQGNISFALGDVGEPPAPERTGVFDLTHVRFLLAWALTAGAEKVIKNLAGMNLPHFLMSLGPDCSVQIRWPQAAGYKSPSWKCQRTHSSAPHGMI